MTIVNTEEEYDKEVAYAVLAALSSQKKLIVEGLKELQTHLVQVYYDNGESDSGDTDLKQCGHDQALDQAIKLVEEI